MAEALRFQPMDLSRAGGAMLFKPKRFIPSNLKESKRFVLVIPPEALPAQKTLKNEALHCQRVGVAIQKKRSASVGYRRGSASLPSEALPPSPARTNPSPEPLNRSAWFSGQRGALPFPTGLQAEALRSGKTRKGKALCCQQVGAVLSSQKREALLLREALNNEALPARAGVAIPNGEALR